MCASLSPVPSLSGERVGSLFAALVSFLSALSHLQLEKASKDQKKKGAPGSSFQPALALVAKSPKQAFAVPELTAALGRCSWHV